MLRNKSGDVGFGVLYGGSAKRLPLEEYMVRKDLNDDERALFEKYKGQSLVCVTQFTAFKKKCIQELLQQLGVDENRIEWVKHVETQMKDAKSQKQ